MKDQILDGFASNLATKTIAADSITKKFLKEVDRSFSKEIDKRTSIYFKMKTRAYHPLNPTSRIFRALRGGNSPSPGTPGNLTIASSVPGGSLHRPRRKCRLDTRSGAGSARGRWTMDLGILRRGLASRYADERSLTIG